MSNSVVANRYALALFELAQEKGQTDLIQSELIEIKKVFRDNKELEQLLGNPKLSMDKKKDLLITLSKGANPLIQNTLLVLLEKKRLHEILNLVDEFIELLNSKSGVADAKVYSTRPLTEAESAEISLTFAQRVGKQSLKIENIIDPTLIGGIRLHIGNRIYDSSLSGKLGRLKRDIIGS